MNFLVVDITSSPLYSWSGPNSVYPFPQVWIALHLLFADFAAFPRPDPRVSIYISNTELSKAIPSKIFSGLAGQAPGKVELKYVVNSECLGLESFNRICGCFLINKILCSTISLPSQHRKGLLTRNLFRSKSSKVIQLTLVRLTRSMPKDEPLRHLRPFFAVGKAEVVIFVNRLHEIEQLRWWLHDRERLLSGVVNENGDSPYIMELI